MRFNKPYNVTVGKSVFAVVPKNEIPRWFSLMSTKVPHKVAFRMAGGCKGMTEQDKLDMIAYFNVVFPGDFCGLFSTGATREVRDGKIDPMITDIAGIVSGNNSEAIVLGTVPRTGLLAIVDDSRMIMGEYDTAVAPDMHGFLIVEEGINTNADWDGDLTTYFGMFDELLQYAGFSAAGTGFWNGGGVTGDEIIMSLQRGWPSILVRGSGRITDDVINWFEGVTEFTELSDTQLDKLNALKNTDSLIVVERDAPLSFRQAMIENGFIEASVDA